MREKKHSRTTPLGEPTGKAQAEPAGVKATRDDRRPGVLRTGRGPTGFDVDRTEFKRELDEAEKEHAAS